MATGTVKNFFADRGFGFITPDAGGVDVFVHIKSCTNMQELSEGQRVRFDERRSERHNGKFEACDVTLLEGDTR